ncbi:MAG: hypothetical protein GC204_05760 [Chloroflexi bacterium]|nr:hypothetical protein [Chloroflexota bacterium]
MNIAALISVFGIAFIYFWASIPAGIAQDLSPILVVVTASISYACGVGIVILAGQPVRDWIMKRFGGKASNNPNSAIHRIWDRYGLFGLALLAPITTGAQIGAVIGISLNAPPRRLFVLMSLGGLLWAVIVAVLVSLGVAAVKR